MGKVRPGGKIGDSPGKLRVGRPLPKIKIKSAAEITKGVGETVAHFKGRIDKLKKGK